MQTSSPGAPILDEVTLPPSTVRVRKSPATFPRRMTRRFVVGLSILAAVLSYCLKLNGTLDGLTAEYYVSGLKTHSHGAIDTAEIVAMQKRGTFPSIAQMSNAVVLSAALTLTRVALTDLVFSPLATWLMALHHISNDYKKRPHNHLACGGPTNIPLVL